MWKEEEDQKNEKFILYHARTGVRIALLNPGLEYVQGYTKLERITSAFPGFCCNLLIERTIFFSISLPLFLDLSLYQNNEFLIDMKTHERVLLSPSS